MMTASTAAGSVPSGGVHLEKYQRLFSVMPVRVMRYMDSSFLTDLKTISSEASTCEWTSLSRVSWPMRS